MGRLDEVDLTKAYSNKEEARGLENAWARLSQLRLTLGAQIGPPLSSVNHISLVSMYDH